MTPTAPDVRALIAIVATKLAELEEAVLTCDEESTDYCRGAFNAVANLQSRILAALSSSSGTPRETRREEELLRDDNAELAAIVYRLHQLAWRVGRTEHNQTQASFEAGYISAAEALLTDVIDDEAVREVLLQRTMNWRLARAVEVSIAPLSASDDLGTEALSHDPACCYCLVCRRLTGRGVPENV